MAALTLTIEPDEFLGLSALVDLDRASNGGNAGSGADAEVVGLARTLMRGALADKLQDAGLPWPWAPSAEAVRQRAAEAAAPASGVRKLMANKKAQKDAMYIWAVAFAVVLWGGYARAWKWTGFQANGQLWDWLSLLLLPVVIGTIPLWMQDRGYIGKNRRVIYGVFIVAWIGFVIAGYAIPLNWTGFRGQTLWNWFGLLLLPAALATTMALPSMRIGLPQVFRSMRLYQKAIIAALAVGWVVTVIGGYALRWRWTGYSGNTLWDWLGLLLLPLLVPTVLNPALFRWISGNADERASRARAATVTPAAAAADR
jgi:hypothetical protein